jgi:hypothetical protein
VLKHVEMLADGRRFNAKTLQTLYTEERRCRTFARQDAKEAAKAHAMRWPSLVKKSQALAGAAAQMRRKGDKRAPVWERMAGIYAAEESCRIEAGEAPTRLLLGRGVSADEQLILAEIDAQRRQRPERQQVNKRGVCSPQTTPSTIQPDLFADAPAQTPYYVGYINDMVARLKNSQGAAHVE